MGQRGVTAIQLSRETNLPLSSIKKIRNGSNSNPTISTLLPIARIFCIDVEELVSNDLMSLQKSQSEKNKFTLSARIPVIQWDEILLWPNIELSKTHFICTEKQVSELSFALNVEAEDWIFFTMGSLLLIDPLFHPSHRDYVIVYKVGMPQPSLKQILIEDEKIYIQSVRIPNNIELISDQYRILGIVIENRKSLKRTTIQKKAIVSTDKKPLSETDNSNNLFENNF